MHLFYKPDLEMNSILEGDEFHHCTKVLRLQEGDKVFMTDGQGLLCQVTIDSITKWALQFSTIEESRQSPKPFRIHLFICPTKNLDRMEWMVEKAAEIQVDEISFMTTKNSERPKINMKRLEKKVVSALKQSKGAWKTRLNDVESYDNLLPSLKGDSFIAYVEEKQQLLSECVSSGTTTNLLIGPEGDFTPGEVSQALKLGVKAVSLGKSVLRTETAGLLGCHTVNVINGF